MQLSASATRPVITPPRAVTAPVDTRPMRITLDPSLTLDAADQLGRTFVSSASGIATFGPAGEATTWVVSDELPGVAKFGALNAPGTMVEGLAPATKKPDLESVIVLPNDRWGAPPLLFAAGSGSSESRHRGLLFELDAKGAATRRPKTVDLAPLHAALAKRLPMGVNIEGMALRDGAAGQELLLFHRGQIAGDRNVVFTLDAIDAMAALRNDRPIPASAIRGEHVIDLGEYDGAPLGFADARALPDGRIAFIASAEASTERGDGAILGSVVGTLDRDLAVTSLRPLMGVPRKAEGIELARRFDARADANDIVLVTDPDDPAKPAEVLRATL
ncbi:MAG: hypothetical protein JWM86_1343 [Thermoleophilia bacterium]|nr:hypothetical protein [Thermoleophilia bacterium]